MLKKNLRTKIYFLCLLLIFALLWTGCDSEENQSTEEIINYPYLVETELTHTSADATPTPEENPEDDEEGEEEETNDDESTEEEEPESPVDLKLRNLHNAVIRIKSLNSSFGTDNPGVTSVELVRGKSTTTLRPVNSFLTREQALSEQPGNNVIITSLSGILKTANFALTDLFDVSSLSITFSDGNGSTHTVYDLDCRYIETGTTYYRLYNNGLYDRLVKTPSHVSGNSLVYVEADTQGLASSIAMLLNYYGTNWTETKAEEELAKQITDETPLPRSLLHAKRLLNTIDSDRYTARGIYVELTASDLNSRFVHYDRAEEENLQWYMPAIILLQISGQEHYCILRGFDIDDGNPGTIEYAYIGHPALGNIMIPLDDFASFQEGVTAMLSYKYNSTLGSYLTYETDCHNTAGCTDSFPVTAEDEALNSIVIN